MVSNKITTVKLFLGTKKSLDSYKEYRNESYDEIVAKLVRMAGKDGQRLREIRKKRKENGLETIKAKRQIVKRKGQNKRKIKR